MEQVARLISLPGHSGQLSQLLGLSVFMLEIEKIDRDNVIVDLDQVHHAIGFSIVHVRAISCW